MQITKMFLLAFNPEIEEIDNDLLNHQKVKNSMTSKLNLKSNHRYKNIFKVTSSFNLVSFLAKYNNQITFSELSQELIQFKRKKSKKKTFINMNIFFSSAFQIWIFHIWRRQFNISHANKRSQIFSTQVLTRRVKEFHYLTIICTAIMAFNHSLRARKWNIHWS